MTREHARALRILADHGADEERARSILHAFGQAGIHLVLTEPPAEPDTGPRATDPNPHVENLRAIVRDVRTAPIIATEYEENEA